MAKLENLEPVTVEFRVVRPDGELRLLQARGQLRPDANGAYTRVIGTSLDVTERRATERALRASEESYRTIFQSASDAMWLHEFERGKMLEVNEAACDLLGYSAEEQREIGLDRLYRCRRRLHDGAGVGACAKGTGRFGGAVRVAGAPSRWKQGLDGNDAAHGADRR